jgi:hypothetical protein
MTVSSAIGLAIAVLVLLVLLRVLGLSELRVAPGEAVVCSLSWETVSTYAQREDLMTMSPVQRPGSVTVVVVLTWISAILALFDT